MSIKCQGHSLTLVKGHSLTLVKGHSDIKVKCLTFGLYTQVSDAGPQGPLVIYPSIHPSRTLPAINKCMVRLMFFLQKSLLNSVFRTLIERPNKLRGYFCLSITNILACFLLNPIALRKAKIVYNFGLSECNRVNS